jgi:hypothetical protein
MADVTTITLFFILVGGIILVLMLVRSNSGSGWFRVGQAELRIDFDNSPGFQHPTRRPRGRPGAPPARYYLHVKDTGWRYPLGEQHVYIGRSAGCQIRLRDAAADSRQAVIYLEGGRYKINNLSPRSPTWVNDRPITTQNLGNGNKIRTGRTEFIFRDSKS